MKIAFPPEMEGFFCRTVRSSLAEQEASVYGEVDPGDEAGLLARQEGHGPIWNFP